MLRLRRSGMYFRQDAPGNAGKPPDPQNQPAADPWRQHLPESLRAKPIEDIAKSYAELHTQVGSLNNDLGGFKKKLADSERYRQASDQWGQWWQNLSSAAPGLAKALHESGKYSEYEQWWNSRQAQPQPGNRQQQQPGGEDLYEGWEGLDPREQARRLSESSRQQFTSEFQTFQQGLQKMLQEKEQLFQQALAQERAYNQNYHRIWQQVMDAKAKNPSLDTDAAMQRALEIAQGQIDPLQLGMQLSSLGQEREARDKELRALWDQEQKALKDNQQITPPVGSTTVPSYRITPPAAGGAGQLRESAAKAIAEKFGPGVF